MTSSDETETCTGTRTVPEPALSLFRVYSVHYSPKDSKLGTDFYLVASDEEQVWERVQGLIHDPDDWDEDDDQSEVHPDENWWAANPDAVERAQALGLTVHDSKWDDWVSGDRVALYRWFRGDHTEVSDTYYGATRYFWTAGLPLDAADACVLVRLELAENLTSQTWPAGGAS